MRIHNRRCHRDRGYRVQYDSAAQQITESSDNINHSTVHEGPATDRNVDTFGGLGAPNLHQLIGTKTK
jgi:hypothetical protein